MVEAEIVLVSVWEPEPPVTVTVSPTATPGASVTPTVVDSPLTSTEPSMDPAVPEMRTVPPVIKAEPLESIPSDPA